jgi:hypothetical protein
LKDELRLDALALNCPHWSPGSVKKNEKPPLQSKFFPAKISIGKKIYFTKEGGPKKSFLGSDPSVMRYAGVQGKNNAYHNVNKVQNSFIDALILNLIDIVVCVVFGVLLIDRAINHLNRSTPRKVEAKRSDKFHKIAIFLNLTKHNHLNQIWLDF